MTKYPPSLLYLPIFLALAAAERMRGLAIDFLVVFGRVPFFCLLHSMAVALGCRASRRRSSSTPSGSSRRRKSRGWVYVAWAAAVLVLSPRAGGSRGLKSRRKDWWWLSYL